MPEISNPFPDDFGLSPAAASSLCGWSERTVWRKLASGQLRRFPAKPARTCIAYSSLLPYLDCALDEESIVLLKAADAGCVRSQAELALLLRGRGKTACALHWLKLAAEAGEADAMVWLGRAYLCAEGLAFDRNLGLMWLARSAAQGHGIADGILSALSHSVLAQARALSESALSR